MKKLTISCLAIIMNTGISYASDIQPINDFNISKYLGKWYEVARLPNRFENKCIAPITANYSVDPDNNNKIIIVNQCNTEDNQIDTATGVATFVESSNIGKLKVTFLPKWLRWLPFGYGDYWILNTDYSEIAVVGSPDREYLWILARTEKISLNLQEGAVLLAKNRGFDTTKLIFNYLDKKD
ncbi:MAG: lipocalin family protein [Neisseriaceae bacterium]